MVNGSKRRGLDRERIVAAAARRFARYGYRKTSLAEIAADLHVVKGALYYHFPDGKLGIFDAACATAEAEALAALRAAVDDAAEPRAALRALAETKLRWMLAKLDALEVAPEVGLELVRVTRREDAYLGQERALIERVLARGKADGSLAGVGAVKPTARLLQSLLRWAVHEAALGDASGAPPTRRLPKELFGILLDGLAARPAGRQRFAS